ncbi:F-box protein [Quillaja saponaria]|uniref:F-box protein n=1 Tax=Quillaja saponaria TaxID=32244 RepID=A0AAD7PEC8_QUISA|nr:F-box protein [Quillaja saponaria]
MEMVDDRISDLCECIIHHILSFLPQTDVVKTSTLSKRWQKVWASNPNLEFEFDKDMFGHEQEFIKYVDYTLERFCTQNPYVLQKLKLSLIDFNFEEAHFHISKWIAWAIEKQVGQLKLQAHGYSLPQTIFSLESLTTLELSDCKLEHPSIEKPGNSIKLPSLQKLSLCYVDADKAIVEQIIQNCPLITDIAINQCHGLFGISVSGQTKLRKLEIIDPFHLYREDLMKKIYIDAPNLYCLTIGSRLLKSITLWGDKLTGKMFYPGKDEDLNCHVPVLKVLNLKCQKLRKFSISSPSLKVLNLDQVDLEEADIYTPNLLLFQYTNCVCNTPKFSIHAPCPWEITIHSALYETDTSLYLSLREFLGKSSRVMVLNIAILLLQGKVRMF